MSLEQQTATASILRAIASSPTDAQSVLQSIVDEAMRLCEANSIAVSLVRGDEIERVAIIRRGGGLVPVGARFPLDRGVLSGRAIIEGRTIQHEDLHPILEQEYPISAQFDRVQVERLGTSATVTRSFLGIPLLA